MAREEDPESKTEEASPRRVDEFRRRGEVAFSRDLMSASAMLGGGVAVVLTGLFLPGRFGELWGAMMSAAASSGGARIGAGTFWEALLFLAQGLALPMGVGVAVALLTGLAQTQGNLSWEPLALKPEKLNPFPKLVGLFVSKRAVVELAKNAFKVTALGAVAWWVAVDFIPELMTMPRLGLEAALSLGGELLLRLMGALCVAMVAFAALDVAWQRYQMAEKMKMSRQELKDEHKDIEGDPALRGARRQRMREMAAARGRVQAAREATVIVVNPTHVAVALRYDPKKESAPRVLCKGTDQVAAEIREVARKAGVPIIQRRALARLLFKTARVGREIPADLYEAVASVLALVLRGRLPRPGLPPEPPPP
jgi:flagellar biosynthetic protein FlhB